MTALSCCYRLLLLLWWLCTHWTCGAAHSGPGQLLPPANIRFGMNGMFCLFWKWEPSADTANCSRMYRTEVLISYSNKTPKGEDKYPYYTPSFDNRIDLNNDITLKVCTICGNNSSACKNFTAPLVTGNPRTMVRNMTCVWSYKEYVNCTWIPGEGAPPSVNYIMRYWINEYRSCGPVGNKEPTQFRDMIDKGNLCQNYIYDNGIPVGCQFSLVELDFNNFINLVAVVTDRSQNIKPYIYFAFVNTIAKLKPPVICKMERIPNDNMLLIWNVSNAPKLSEYQVQVNKETYLVAATNSLNISNVLPDETYTVKVRAKLPDHTGLVDGQQYLWSEWSEKRMLQAAKGGKTTFTVLLLLVSFVIIVAVILLLINMKRLRMLICPQVPDPSKGISSDFQHWLKYGKSVYNEPKKEEVCLVSLLETSPLSSPVESDHKWKM